MTDSTEPLSLRMSRVIRASPPDVFDAYTDADKQKVWFTILDERPGIVEITVDLRVGGIQTAVWGPDEENLIREVQTFLVIDRPHRLVTESFGTSPDGMTMTTQIELTFEPHGNGDTLVTVVQSGFPVPEIRDFFEAEVWNGALLRIATFVERGR